MRIRQLWAPVLFTSLISVAVQFVALRVPQLPPWVFFSGRAVRVIVPGFVLVHVRAANVSAADHRCRIFTVPVSF